LSIIAGINEYFIVREGAPDFFVASRSIPGWVITITLGAQSIDSNALLGNADLSYRYAFWDGVVLPMGLGLSLVLNGLVLSHHINGELVLTLPDVYARRYGKSVEILVSAACVASFMMLLAGNFVGMGTITRYCWGTSQTASVWIAAFSVWLYTVGGGLCSVAYTDIVHAFVGWSGCFVASYYMITHAEPEAPPPSIGFPGEWIRLIPALTIRILTLSSDQATYIQTLLESQFATCTKGFRAK
jgi:Na+/proline symporter